MGIRLFLYDLWSKVLLNLITFSSARLLINGPSGEVKEVMLLLLLLSTWKMSVWKSFYNDFQWLLHGFCMQLCSISISLFLRVNLRRGQNGFRELHCCSLVNAVDLSRKQNKVSLKAYRKFSCHYFFCSENWMNFRFVLYLCWENFE